jgi:transcription elongation factor Elf1
MNVSLTLCQAVSCKIDDATRIGYLSCGRCGQKFQCQTNPIMAAIDVYSEWIDATEEVNTAD